MHIAPSALVACSTWRREKRAKKSCWVEADSMSDKLPALRHRCRHGGRKKLRHTYKCSRFHIRYLLSKHMAFYISPSWGESHVLMSLWKMTHYIIAFAHYQLTEMIHSFLHPFKVLFPTQSPSETLGVRVVLGKGVWVCLWGIPVPYIASSTHNQFIH